MRIENILDRKERLKGEGKIELPLDVDTKKYLFRNIAFVDIFIVSPFIILSLIIVLILWKTGFLNPRTIIISSVPTVAILVLQLIKHPIRKRNLTFLQFGILWRINYKRRNKEFFYRKGAIDMENKKDKDTRKELGIKNVFSGCYETTDNRFVKVLEVSSINLSLMNNAESRKIYEAYGTFLSEIQFLNSIEICQISQPVNLSKYLLQVDEATENEKHFAKRMIISSYKKHIEQIQRSRNMVARKRYVIVDHPISSDREKSLAEVERKASLLEMNINGMLRGYSKLNATILKNDDLIKLIYTCLDYDNAQALGNHIVSRANNKANVSLGVTTAKEIIETYQKQIEEKIN